jgi:hypothetical protein
MLKRTTSKVGGLGIIHMFATYYLQSIYVDLDLLASPKLGSPRISVGPLSPVLSSPRHSLMSTNGPASPRPNKIPIISMVSLQTPLQYAQPKPPTPPTVRIPSPFQASPSLPSPTTPPSDSVINPVSSTASYPVPPLSPAPQTLSPSPSPRVRAMSAVPSPTSTLPPHEYPIPSRSYYEGAPPSPAVSPSPSPRVLRHSPYSPRVPYFVSADNLLRNTISKDDDPANPNPEKAKFDPSQNGKRNFPNRQATSILAREVIDAVRASKVDEKEVNVNGPSAVVREVKDLVKEINLRIEEEKQEKESENNGKGEKGKAKEKIEVSEKVDSVVIRRSATFSTPGSQGEKMREELVGSNLKMSWKMGDLTAVGEASNNNNNNGNSDNNGLRKRAWTRGHLAYSEGNFFFFFFFFFFFCISSS